MHPALDNDSPIGKAHLFPDLGFDVPVSLLQSRCNKFGADVAFG